MNSDTITIILASLLILLYFTYIIMYRKEDESKTNALLGALREYAKTHPDLAQTLNKFGLF